MPEGHTIHRLARDQRADLRGGQVRAWSPQGRFADGAARIDGAALTRVDAWGKHLFHQWSTGEVLHVHLGLIGKFVRRADPAPPPVGAVRLRIEGPTRTWDLSGPAICEVVTREDRAAVVARLGPDPLRADADPGRFVTRVRKSPRPIGDLLLDQGVVAGIGNVYRAELLHLTGIHPATPGRALSEDQLLGVWDLAVTQLRAGVRRNRIVTVDPATLSGPIARVRRGEGVHVYHQDVCRRCGTAVETLELGGRRIEACPTCQPRTPETPNP